MSQLKIGNVTLDNNIVLAPMAGVTDLPFRLLCKEQGAGLICMEMISAKAIYFNNKNTMELMEIHPEECPVSLQLFGSDADIIAEMAKRIEERPFAILDINMGCPAPKIVKNGEGSALMQNIELAKQIITECVKASKKPITIKFRAGWNNNINAVEFAKMCESAGASAITIHGRTREQFYAGKSDLELIKQVKQAVSIPVIGNGDVVDLESYKAMLNTGVDAVMVGRGALGNPEIFAELTGNNVEVNKFEDIKKHIEILREHYPEHLVVKEMRKHILWYLKGYHNCTEIKNQVVREKDINVVLETLKNFFEVNKKREGQLN